jgi:hypothetical protein
MQLINEKLENAEAVNVCTKAFCRGSQGLKMHGHVFVTSESSPSSLSASFGLEHFRCKL